MISCYTEAWKSPFERFTCNLGFSTEQGSYFLDMKKPLDERIFIRSNRDLRPDTQIRYVEYTFGKDTICYLWFFRRMAIHGLSLRLWHPLAFGRRQLVSPIYPNLFRCNLRSMEASKDSNYGHYCCHGQHCFYGKKAGHRRRALFLKNFMELIDLSFAKINI